MSTAIDYGAVSAALDRERRRVVHLGRALTGNHVPTPGQQAKANGLVCRSFARRANLWERAMALKNIYGGAAMQEASRSNIRLSRLVADLTQVITAWLNGGSAQDLGIGLAEIIEDLRADQQQADLVGQLSGLITQAIQLSTAAMDAAVVDSLDAAGRSDPSNGGIDNDLDEDDEQVVDKGRRRSGSVFITKDATPRWLNRAIMKQLRR
jgi:hypothetical protein